MQINDDIMLVWSDAEQRPTNEQWSGKAADRWPSLGEAIRFAIAMQADKAALGLSPWIWTPSGHVYSPGTITAMGRAFEENMLRARGMRSGLVARPPTQRKCSGSGTT